MKTAITGGIGSGKSFVCRLLEQRGITIYDCDQAAKRLMRTSDVICRKLTELIGPDAYFDDVPNKAAITRYLMASPENAQAINSIVHPAVADDFEHSQMEWMECAILYESGFDRLVDRVFVVTAPEEVRIDRIMRRDGISRQKAEEWIARQWPQEELVRRAGGVIINDGTMPLIPQIDRLLNT